MFGKSMGVKVFLCGLVILVLLSGCGNGFTEQAPVENKDAANEEELFDETETEPSKSEDVFTEEEVQSEPEELFELTEEGKTFLLKMCMELTDFDDQTEKDEGFWLDFLFLSYTGASAEDADMEQVYREDLGFDETVVKVSLQEAEDYAQLVFGVELPDIKPAFEDMDEGQTACYYQDGYYYIGVSDFPDCQYTFAEFTAYDEEDAYGIVKYNIDFEGESNVGTVSFVIVPADNENGFVIHSKETELFE